MAEDNFAEGVEEINELVAQPPEQECNARIEELAKPKRWRLLGTWKCFADILDPIRVQRIKEKVQELFSMTPEQAEIYFNSMRQKKSKKIDIRAIRMQLKKEKAAARRQAYCILHVILKKAMKYSFKHPPPLIVTPILRIISDHVLELLCQLHKIPLPKRTENDLLSTFLIRISDWTAIYMSNVYYEIEVTERQEIEKEQKLAQSDTVSTITPPVQISEAASVVSEVQTAVVNYDDEFTNMGGEGDEDFVRKLFFSPDERREILRKHGKWVM